MLQLYVYNCPRGNRHIAFASCYSGCVGFKQNVKVPKIFQSQNHKISLDDLPKQIQQKSAFQNNFV